jgi:predicted AlkP superfamily phosphohydrolase/phosphomutase
VIPQFYEKVDAIVGELIQEVPEDTHVILMSDHGCGPIYGLFALNRWLYEEGLLRLRRSAGFKKLRTNLRWMRLGQIMDKLGLEKEFLKDSVLSLLLKTKWPVIKRQVEESWQVINWKKTRVYGSLGGDSMILIRLNLKGREPDGVVVPGQEEKDLLDLLKKKLLALTHPETGKNLVEKVYDADELYTGPFMKFAPDLVGIFKDFEYIATGRVLKKKWLEDTFSGQHRMEGICVMKGENIHKGREMSSCEIIDLAPTILYLLDMAVPSDMDGKVLEELFDPSFFENHPVRYRKPHEGEMDIKILDAGATREDKQEITDLLKGLGYID